MPTISLTEVGDVAALEPPWRALEARANGSFFTGWTWVGCAAAARFSRAVLLEARAGPDIVALGLFNRGRAWPARETLWLGESGERGLDDVFVEHNGLLVHADAAPDVPKLCLEAMLHLPIAPRRRRGGRRLILSGVSGALERDLKSAGGHVIQRRAMVAPRVDYADVTGEYLGSLSANARYQIRRSDRRYAERGRLAITRADDLATALAWLDALAVLHQRTWIRRERPGAFANPRFTAFHKSLIARGFPRQEIDLLRVTAGDHVVGYLYNFRHQNRVATYQSGFDYDAAGPHEKPGLTSHRLAIEFYRAAGFRTYDFLAGDHRYKSSLANASETLVWLDATPRRSPLGRLRSAREFLRGIMPERIMPERMIRDGSPAGATGQRD
jgi:CelD/BcsL family acetyltransferase involved in cellulose biosynthesis